MVAPTITSVTPAEGLTRGETFVEIVGTGFNPPIPRLLTDPPTGPSTKVYFDDVEAIETRILSPTLIHVLTPRTVQIAPSAVDVKVENTTPSPPGADVVESVVAPGAFEYKRPDLSTRADASNYSALLIVTRQILRELKTHVLQNTHFDMHSEYVDQFSVLVGEEVQIKVDEPILKVLAPSLVEERGVYAFNGEFNVPGDPDEFTQYTQPVHVRATYPIEGVGRTSGEAMQLWAALTSYFHRTPDLIVPRDGADKANGVVAFEWRVIWEDRGDFTQAKTRQNVNGFTKSIEVRGVLIDAAKVREGWDVTEDPDVVSEQIPLPPKAPFVIPSNGPVGTFFTVTDARARIQTGDVALFYPVGLDPLLAGVTAGSISISSDGTKISGVVPALAPGQHFISVRRPGDNKSRFKPDRLFTVDP